MKLLTIFNNKGGVGKTTLLYHLACVLADMGKRVLLLDLDSQCNLTLFGVSIERLHEIWESEDTFFDEGYEFARRRMGKEEFENFMHKPHTIHFILKPTEDGCGEPEQLPTPISLFENLDLIPGRLSLYTYESVIASRWNDVYAGQPLAVRTISRIREVALGYAEEKKYDYILMDTSPSLGMLNKIIIMNSDGFIIPALPDMFSLYGIRNIGSSIKVWKKELDIIFNLISDEKRKMFPAETVQFLGYTIYNAKKGKSRTIDTWNLAQAHYDYAKQIPNSIVKYIPQESIRVLSKYDIDNPIGKMAVMLTHNTYPSTAQKYRVPIWKIPDCQLDEEDKTTILGNRQRYYDIKKDYIKFANDFIDRVRKLEER